ncbi:MAG: 2-phosphosulfolactate phosphatase [Rikenellaceae bacterium]
MALKVDVIESAATVSAEKIKDHSTAIIDIFRATSVMCAAFNNGAQRIIPLTDIDQVFELREKLLEENPEAKILMGGERKTLLIEGFDLDNSPLAYTRERVEAATILMSTTNGTRTINAASASREIYIASLLNAKAIVEKLIESQNDISIICAGRLNTFTMEDGLCAGYMAKLLAKQGYELSDFAWVMADLYTRYSQNLRESLKNGLHYNAINERLQEDVKYSIQLDIMTITPKVYIDETKNYQEIRLG